MLSCLSALYEVDKKSHCYWCGQGSLRSPECKHWKFFNTASQYSNHSKIWYLECKFVISRRQTLLFSVKVNGHFGSAEFKLGKPSIQVQYLKKGSLDRCDMCYVGVVYSVQETHCFYCRSKVIWIQQVSVKTIWTWYLKNWSLYRFPIWYVYVSYWAQKVLLLLVDFKGHLGLKGFKLLEHCKHDITRREAWTDLMYGVCSSVPYWASIAHYFLQRPTIIWESTGMKFWKPCKHDISEREGWPELIFDLQMSLIECKKSIDYVRGEK